MKAALLRPSLERDPFPPPALWRARALLAAALALSFSVALACLTAIALLARQLLSLRQPPLASSTVARWGSADPSSPAPWGASWLQQAYEAAFASGAPELWIAILSAALIFAVLLLAFGAQCLACSGASRLRRKAAELAPPGPKPARRPPRAGV